jgi:hypothetical protein
MSEIKGSGLIEMCMYFFAERGAFGQKLINLKLNFV